MALIAYTGPGGFLSHELAAHDPAGNAHVEDGGVWDVPDDVARRLAGSSEDVDGETVERVGHAGFSRVTNLDKLTVEQLGRVAEIRGVAKSGTKAELAKRIRGASAKPSSSPEPEGSKGVQVGSGSTATGGTTSSGTATGAGGAGTGTASGAGGTASAGTAGR
jgi:hypothetical protein